MCKEKCKNLKLLAHVNFIQRVKEECNGVFKCKQQTYTKWKQIEFTAKKQGYKI